MIGSACYGAAQEGHPETDEKSSVTFLVVNSFGTPLPQYSLTVWRTAEETVHLGNQEPSYGHPDTLIWRPEVLEYNEALGNRLSTNSPYPFVSRPLVIENKEAVGTLEDSGGPLELPHGRYLVSAEAPLCDPSQRWVEFFDPERFVVIALTCVSNELNSEEDRPLYRLLRGTVRGMEGKSGEILWCRLYPVYGDFSRLARIDQGGKFTVDALLDGEYLLSVFQGAKLVHTERISTRTADREDREIVLSVSVTAKKGASARMGANDPSSK
jgi:hypothetical protein